MTPVQRIAESVRAEMAAQRKTQDQLGTALDLPQSAVSLRLSGRRPFRAEELEAVAVFLGVPVTRFLGSPIRAVFLAAEGE